MRYPRTIAAQQAFQKAFRRRRRCQVSPIGCSSEADRRQQPDLIEMTGAVANLVLRASGVS